MSDPESLSPELTETEKKLIRAVEKNPKLAYTVSQSFFNNGRDVAIAEMKKLKLMPIRANEDMGTVLTKEPGNRQYLGFEF